MFIDTILPELIVVSIIGCSLAIFGYLRRKFNCQNTIQIQLNQITKKVDVMMEIYKMILQDTHPDKIKELDRLLKIASTTE